jgi:multiple sugar transport system permease protein
MTTTSIDAPVGAQTTSRGNGRRPQPGSGHHILAYLFLGVLVVYFFIPIWWLFVASTKDAAGLFNGSSGALWFDETFALLPNLRDLFTYNEGIYVRWVANSLFYAIAGGAGATVLCVLAGYGFAKFRFRGRRLMLAVLLGSVMVPLTALVIPTFILFSNLHLTDTVWAVILPSLLNPFGVYLMQVYTAEAVPDELLEAARVDGAGEIKTFFRVALPLLRPAVITVLLLSIVGVWNNFFLPWQCWPTPSSSPSPSVLACGRVRPQATTAAGPTFGASSSSARWCRSSRSSSRSWHCRSTGRADSR